MASMNLVVKIIVTIDVIIKAENVNLCSKMQVIMHHHRLGMSLGRVIYLLL